MDISGLNVARLNYQIDPPIKGVWEKNNSM